MTDRELLELAAKAAGIDWFDEPAAKQGRGLHLKSGRFWNPLTDDGDALRLAVTLKIDVMHTSVVIQQVHAMNYHAEATEIAVDDPYAATRRAIVRAAALEEAAQVCEELDEEASWKEGRPASGRECAAAIQEMKEQA